MGAIKVTPDSSKCASCLTAHLNSKSFGLEASTQIAAKLKAETADKVRIFVFVFLFIIQGLQYKFVPNYKRKKKFFKFLLRKNKKSDFSLEESFDLGQNKKTATRAILSRVFLQI